MRYTEVKILMNAKVLNYFFGSLGQFCQVRDFSYLSLSLSLSLHMKTDSYLSSFLVIIISFKFSNKNLNIYISCLVFYNMKMNLCRSQNQPRVKYLFHRKILIFARKFNLKSNEIKMWCVSYISLVRKTRLLQGDIGSNCPV